MGLLVRLGSALVGPLVRWSAAHPFRTAGLAAALLATWVTLSALGLSVSGPATVTAEGVVAFATARPAYPAAILLGLGTFLFAR